MEWLFTKPGIVVLGLVAAALVTVGTWAKTKGNRKFAGVLIKVGYVFFFLSIGMFIISGFMAQQ
ncbi:MAG: hypothetical protein LLG06_12780 [Desulfobacteraceae bacterium]|nr:hypothetical protein [Desulfobacteraceae bacterium]